MSKYSVMVDFIRSCLKHSCCLCASDCCVACGAKEVLEHIGEPLEPKVHTDNILDDRPVHTWFELSYSSYLILPRLFMEAMPYVWQCQFVDLLNELKEAIELDPSYTGKYRVTMLGDGNKFAKDPYRDYRRGKVTLKTIGDKNE